ncbi:ribosome-associated protein [Anaerobranca californiensis DSM 14826]|jgi:ribosome-associated protein|uniref:Ribosome-associated protein n=1 Tax=Anaerobranca californiensis DSM 14826 TaxID=1120989 RepID=A0A1M6M1J0_9FIRM|nr:S4 domain-containing protein YaaA [Anaerobranca californiensis]SHJ77328.1 ribosome-associated protein [Anaerobranca californiensis DSM 14826]
MNIVKIETEFIQLQQFLKLINVVESGGQGKIFIQEGNIKVNGEIETRRGRKLYPNDKITIKGIGDFVIK